MGCGSLQPAAGVVVDRRRWIGHGPAPRFPDVDCAGGSSTPCVGRDYELWAALSLTAAGPAPLARLDVLLAEVLNAGDGRSAAAG
jgi:hypothetical protein